MLLLASSVCGLFKWRQFEPEVILLAVGWYLRFSLSYRDVEELLAERGLHADHVTVWRWVQRYAPELQRRLRRHLKPTSDSWRVDETYIRIKGKWRYLYRAVDSSGATLDFLLSAKQDAAAAKRFLAKASEILTSFRINLSLFGEKSGGDLWSGKGSLTLSKTGTDVRRHGLARGFPDDGSRP